MPVIAQTLSAEFERWPPTENGARPRGVASQAVHRGTDGRSRVALAARQQPVPQPPVPVPPPNLGPANMPFPAPLAGAHPVQPELVPTPVPSGLFTFDQLTLIAEQHNPILARSEADIEAAMGERIQADRRRQRLS